VGIQNSYIACLAVLFTMIVKPVNRTPNRIARVSQDPVGLVSNM
jgi:hypothetical protein